MRQLTFLDDEETQVRELIDKGALFVINHSGGKDSQAMFLKLSKMIPNSQIKIIHASLGRFEWPGTIKRVQSATEGYALKIVRANINFIESHV